MSGLLCILLHVLKHVVTPTCELLHAKPAPIRLSNCTNRLLGLASGPRVTGPSIQLWLEH